MAGEDRPADATDLVQALGSNILSVTSAGW